ncbi:hypothetical protein D3C71_1686520 [compost metagenome]
MGWRLGTQLTGEGRQLARVGQQFATLANALDGHFAFNQRRPAVTGQQCNTVGWQCQIKRLSGDSAPALGPLPGLHGVEQSTLRTADGMHLQHTAVDRRQQRRKLRAVQPGRQGGDTQFQ